MTTLSQISIPGTTSTLAAARANADIQIALRPACEAVGLDYSGQLQRLNRQAWAVVGVTPTTGADGKTYDMVTVDRRTFTMWLATLTASRIKSLQARQVLEVFQREAADALDRYFHEGLAVNAAMSDREIVAKALRLVNDELDEAKERIARLEPRAEYVTRYVADNDLRIFRNVAKSNGLSESDLRRVLIEHRWIYREQSSRWSENQGCKIDQYRYSAYADFRDYFRPVPNHQAPRFKGEVDHTLKITPAGALAIGRALTRWGLVPAQAA